jgi:Mg2+ and Co2+ transporter CorA
MPVIRLALGCCLIGSIVNAASPLTEDIENELRVLEQRLDATQSRVLRRSEHPLERSQVERDLGASEQRLRTLKTRQPNAKTTPPLERQLDRLNRPARIREPNPPGLLDPD